MELSEKDSLLSEFYKMYADPKRVANLVLSSNQHGARLYKQSEIRESYYNLKATCPELFVLPDDDGEGEVFSAAVSPAPRAARDGVPKSVKAPSKKDLIIHMIRCYLRETNVDFGAFRSSKEQHQAINIDLNKRYGRTLKAINRFLSVQFGAKDSSFHWGDLAVEDRRIFELVVEDLLFQLFDQDLGLPLHLAADSWAVRSMISVKINNLTGNVKRAVVSHVNFCSIHS